MEKRDKAGAARNEKVVTCLYPKPDAVVRLICFPWAGGGSVDFAKWGKEMCGILEVHCIRLAGRESRSEEHFAHCLYEMVDEIICALLPILQDKPFAFFGHSMGSYIAFMTALRLKEKYSLEPMHLFLSSFAAPHSKNRYQVPNKEDITEEEFLSFCSKSRFFSHSTFNNKEVNKKHHATLIADVKLIRNYTFKLPSEVILSCDFSCFLGSEDVIKTMEDWKDLTRGRCNNHMLPGNHFYLYNPSNKKFLQNYIVKCLEIMLLT